MNAFGYIKIAVERNSRTYYLDIPVGASWEECIDVTLEFIPLIKTMRDNALQQVKQQEQSESLPINQESA